MTTIETMTSEQEQAIARIAEGWRERIATTEPILRDQAEAALTALYRYMECDPPTTFLLYDSPAAALSDFPRWRASTGRVVTIYWRYQVPICDPSSYFRRHLKCGWVGAGAVDLGVRRWPNEHRCFAYASAIDGITGGWIAGGLLDDVWKRVRADMGRSWCDVATARTLDRFPDVFDALQDEVGRESPTLQVREFEYFSLGALDWLATEAACAEACRDALSSRMSPDHVTVLTEVARSCGVVYAFERLCVLCERPQTVRTVDGLVTVVFRDGHRLEGSVDLAPC